MHVWVWVDGYNKNNKTILKLIDDKNLKVVRFIDTCTKIKKIKINYIFH